MFPNVNDLKSNNVYLLFKTKIKTFGIYSLNQEIFRERKKRIKIFQITWFVKHSLL
jgi:hypothetical protein